MMDIQGTKDIPETTDASYRKSIAWANTAESDGVEDGEPGT